MVLFRNGVLALLLAVLLAAAWAEEKRYEVGLVLTGEQVKAVKAAEGRSVAVKFTAAQLAAIREVVPEFDLTEMQLKTSLIGRDNRIVLVVVEKESRELGGGGDPRNPLFMANPQPSP
ncbi:MAG TPA: hypothetical protein ENN88_00840 [Candidatus Coatesbacteria bacterium]|nr:hypothetical protein [Candidatus Coatesbacteria bacterium]